MGFALDLLSEEAQINGSTDWQEPSEVHLRSMLRIAEESLGVLYIAETSLQYADADKTVGDVKRWLRTNGFDAAPLAEPSPHRFISVDGDEPSAARVGDVARPIDAAVLATSTLSLADGVAMLRDSPFFFVMAGRRLAGIVTRADLQRPAVGMVVFSLILAAETAMNRVIVVRLGPDWLAKLGDESRQDVEQLYAERIRTNTQITELDCLTLAQRLRLLAKCPGVFEDLGFDDPASIKGWKTRLVDVRNQLAHGGSILGGVQDPVAAIDLFGEIRMFA